MQSCPCCEKGDEGGKSLPAPFSGIGVPNLPAKPELWGKWLVVLDPHLHLLQYSSPPVLPVTFRWANLAEYTKMQYLRLKGLF